ncbi:MULTISPECIES: threonine ammonia-lyase [Candidatus Nitrosocaldus]|uniref:threonine ammonia-lyase n=1 Tax=Candidatus Nitrosocaldus cavascurensis TaxID=2058097 RepID=A0A2K5AS49_9ARCH|nr:MULTISPECIES: threonine ammonia-lyase [Candidatus Nitrosocaldus]SPC34439.1 L-threonine ammonia-lyase [Candidatus Nitrosocaldus cavascurensis]
MLSMLDISKAREMLKGVIHRTPLDYSTTFSRLAGCNVYLKMECFQKTGSFKVRGAYTKIRMLSEEERSRGVITASAGNHAQGVAYASRILKIPCTVVMPLNASPAKVSATRAYGAEIVFHGSIYDQAWEKAMEIAREQGKTFIHAFDDASVIAGQGTIGLEIMEDMPSIDVIIVPVGGGGLAAGIALAVKSIKPDVRIVGVQSKAFSAMKESLEQGRVVEVSNGSTIADGISVRKPGELTLSILKRYMDHIATVDDDAIVKAMFLLMERAKVVVEPAGAVGLAYLLNAPDVDLRGKNIAVVLSGGNVDMFLLGQIVHKGLVGIGRLIRISVQLVDRPGEFKRVVDTIAASRVNIVDVIHDRLGQDVKVGNAKVILSLEAEDMEHAERLMMMLKEQGIKYELLS